MQRGLQKVQESLKAEPQLASIPKDFMSLQTSVAKVGSEISDLKPTVDVLKDANKNLLNTQNITQQKLSSLEVINFSQSLFSFRFVFSLFSFSIFFLIYSFYCQSNNSKKKNT